VALEVQMTRFATRTALLLGCALAAVGGMAGRAQAQAFNGTPATQFGSVTYNRATPGVETVTINSPTAVIVWTPTAGVFLPAGNVATFQDGVSSTGNFVVLNRISSATPVRFDGTVLSQLVNGAGGPQTGGTVIFASPGGLIIGATGVFDVGSLVLTTLNVDIDAAGNFYDAGTRGLTFSAGPSPIAGATIVTEAGAQIRALQPDSYVAMVGPVIQHGGSVRVNGSAAYVAGEQVTFRANQGLFDIIVDVGSDNAVPLTHTGTTGGPASTGAGDNHAIYLVAMPRNQAITAVLQGDIGFDPAVSASVENGEVVLSAGANVRQGEVDRYGFFFPGAAPDLAASFEIRGGIVRSDLTGVARTDIRAQPTGTPTLTFQQDVNLFGTRSAVISASAGQSVDVLGNALVSAAALESVNANPLDLTGGQARIYTQGGGTIHFFGTATVDASAQGRFGNFGTAGSGTGGSADVTATGGTITIDGALAIYAAGAGGFGIDPPIVDGGAGIGGTASLAASAGGTVNANAAVTMDAGGAATQSGPGATRDAASGTGGTVLVLAGAGGTIAIAAPFTAAANGTGGTQFDFGSGFAGGNGNAGTINIQSTGGAIAFNGGATFTATGAGGDGPVGGRGEGGDLLVEATGGSIDFLGQAGADVGGTGGGSSQLSTQGGEGQGGTIQVVARSGAAPARIGGGAITLSATGRGGSGGNALTGVTGGTGGNGSGGSVSVLAESGNGTVALGAVQLVADGLGGGGGVADSNNDGGAGGLGTGGSVLIGTTAGSTGAPAPTGSATFASATLSARGLGGGGGFGRGSGGTGVGGTASLSATGAPATVTGATTLNANGLASAGGSSPTAGTGTSGQARGGIINIGASAAGAAGTLNLAAVTGSASGLGADSNGNVAGRWNVGASGGSIVNAASMTLTAEAEGTAPGAPPASTVDLRGGTVNVTGTASLSTDGDIQVLASQTGRMTGGRVELVSGDDVSVSHTGRTAGAYTIDVANLYVQAADAVTVDAGAATRATDITDIRAPGLATIGGQVNGRQITIGSNDVDVQASGGIGDAATELAVLDAGGGNSGPLSAGVPAGPPLGPTQFTVIGGTTNGQGYTLTAAEAGRIRAGTLRILAPALGTGATRPPDLIVRDLTVNGGGASAGVGILQIITPGIGRVEGAVLMSNARPQDGILINARDRLEVPTPVGSVRVRDAAGAPGGTLSLISNNLWVASSALIDLLRADPNYVGRDDDLLDNGGNEVPRGYVEGGAVTLTSRGTLYVQNTGSSLPFTSNYGGITTGAGGLTIIADAPNTNVYAFGRRLNADGSFTSGNTFFFASAYNVGNGSGAPGSYTPSSAVNTCIIVTGQCPARGPDNPLPGGKDPITGPTGGSVAILIQSGEPDDVIDSSFASDPLIEQPVTSGSETSLWDCDPDDDGDCDAQPR
jgi:filamentous hemagglutinin family protein